MKEIRLCDDGDIEYTSNLCRKNNLGIEIQGFYNPYITNKGDLLKKHKEILSTISKGKSYHAPFWDLNLGTKIIELQDAMMKIYNEAYYTAKDLNCTEIVIHSNYNPGTYWYSGWIERSKVFLEKFLRDKDDSITLCIENQFEIDSELFIKLIDEINDSRVKICLDIGHVNANSNMSVEEWIKSLNNRIAYYHLHNNHGKQTILGYNKDDEHLGIDNGTIDISKILKLAEEYTPNAIWNIECKVKYLEESIEKLKELKYIETGD